jgi:iron-sulfur cluster insertion protein
MITITDSAVSKIKAIIAEDNEDAMLRIFVEGGGCSGFKYGFSLENVLQEDDLSFEKDGISIIVDAISMQYLQEAEVDYKQTLTSAEFIIKNPNAKASCGCGSSFTI